MSLLTAAPHRLFRRFADEQATFDWYPQQDTESAGHYAVSGYGSASQGTVTGLLVTARQRDSERYFQQQRIMRRQLVVEGAAPGVSTGDKLVRAAAGADAARQFIVAEVVDENGLGLVTRLLLEEQGG